MTSPAPGASFDHGQFKLILEKAREEIGAVALDVSTGLSNDTKRDVIPVSLSQLSVCRSCNRHIFPQDQFCPHCGENLERANARYRQKLQTAMKLAERLKDLLARHGEEI